MMKKIVFVLLVLMTAAVCANAADREAWLFDFETVATPTPTGYPETLGRWPTSSTSTTGVIVDPADASNHVFEMQEKSGNYTSIYVAYIKGLKDRDQVRVSAKLKNQNLYRIGIEACHSADMNCGSSCSNGYAPYNWQYDYGTQYAEFFDYGDDYPQWFIADEEFTYELIDSYDGNTRDGMVIFMYFANDYNVSGTEYGYFDDLVVDVPYYDENGDSQNDVQVIFPDGTSGIATDTIPICSRPKTDIASVDDPNGIDCQANIYDLIDFANQYDLTDYNFDVYTEMPGYQHKRFGWNDPAVLSDPNLALVTIGFSQDGDPYKTYHYGRWDVDDTVSKDTPNSLKCMIGPYSDRVQFYTALITGLNDGDKVYASAWMKKGPDQDSNVRLWAYYIYPTFDIAGFAGGDEGYPLDDGQWHRMSHEWTFDEAGNDGSRFGLVIEIRAYGSIFGQVSGWVDDMVISAPGTANIEFGHTSATSSYQAPVCTERPEADFNLDCKVNTMDFAFIGLEWLDCGYDDSSLCPF